MPERSGRSCCAQEPSLDTAGRHLAGERRRVMVRGVILAASATLWAAAVTMSLPGVGPAALAHRLLWGSAICASGLVAAWIRQAMTTGRPGWRLLATLAAVAIGLAWQPVLPAAAAVAALTEHTLRRSAGANTRVPPGPALDTPTPTGTAPTPHTPTPPAVGIQRAFTPRAGSRPAARTNG